eukprot:CAMPEP_0119414248 /NCGR_PEP_ID=MMETSP1335-20130426/6705_1 /TAXON_ID=259385 /ORGANISM="Chrysoculter rhomboideus, Strain RCC1486" /LENGTH=39 /DNA_ID= /DNA_START= /DNA_END= /DNA_ORIENTATION=
MSNTHEGKPARVQACVQSQAGRELTLRVTPRINLHTGAA